MLRSLLVTFLLLFSGVLSAPAKLERAQPRKLTNAARFAQGLPPLPPTRRTSGVAPRGSGLSNSCPGNTYIKVVKNDHYLGHLGKHVSNTTGQFDIITSLGAWQYLEVSTTFSATAHDIKLLNTDSEYKYLGLADATNGSLDELGYAWLGSTNQTPANSKPKVVGNSRTSPSNANSASESSIWTVSSADKSFYPIFVNADGTDVSGQGVVKQVTPSLGQSGWEVRFLGDWELFSQSPQGKDWKKADLYLECA